MTASILVGGRHRYRGGIQPGWLVLLHEGSGVAWQLVRLHLFEGDEPGGLDEAPGVRWTSSRDADLVGQLSLLLHIHLLQNQELIEAVGDIPQLLTEPLVDLEGISGSARVALQEAVQLARKAGDERCLAVTALPGSSLDLADLMTLPDWEINLAQTVRSRDWDPQERTLVRRRHVPDLLDDIEIAVSRFLTGIVFGGVAGPIVGDFLDRAAVTEADRAVDVLGRWILSALVALDQAGGFAEGEAAGLAPVLEDLTANQARLLSGFLPPELAGAVQIGGELESIGHTPTDLQDLMTLACRVVGQAMAVVSDFFRLPPWLALDALDPSTPRTLPDYID